MHVQVNGIIRHWHFPGEGVQRMYGRYLDYLLEGTGEPKCLGARAEMATPLCTRKEREFVGDGG